MKTTKYKLGLVSLVVLLAVIFVTPQMLYAETTAGMTTGMDLYRASGVVIKKAQGQELSANEMILMFLGMGYVVGFNDAAVITNGDRKNPLFSLPAEGLETEQVMMIVNKYFSAHPEILHESARLCLAMAMKDAFPVEAGK